MYNTKVYFLNLLPSSPNSLMQFATPLLTIAIFFSFVQEFVTEPLDGITLLLDLLRAIQLSQSSGGASHNANGSTTVGKIPPSVQRRTLLDELSCLQCLQSCCTRYSEAVRKLTASSSGLFTLTICIMSNVNKSRIIALQVSMRLFILFLDCLS